MQITFKPLKFIIDRFTLIKANEAKHELISHFNTNLSYYTLVRRKQQMRVLCPLKKNFVLHF